MNKGVRVRVMVSCHLHGQSGENEEANMDLTRVIQDRLTAAMKNS